MDQSACHDAKGKLKANCKTTDGIVVEHVQTDKEKRACTSRLMAWWKKQQEVEKQRQKAVSTPSPTAPKKVSATPQSKEKASWP